MDTFLHTSTAGQAEDHRLVWAELPADLHTPVRAFLALRGSGHRPCLLESAEGPERLARYSFLGLDPEFLLRCSAGRGTLEGPDGREELRGAPEEILRQVAARRPIPAPPPGLPPFCGGWIGSFAYEWACSLEPRLARFGASPEDEEARPEAEFRFFPKLLAFDHAAQRIVLIRSCPEGSAGHPAALSELAALAADLRREPPAPGSFELLGEGPRPCMERARYEAGVASLQAAIRAGEIFQAVLAQRFEQAFRGDPFQLYRVLRLANPAPHMFYFEGQGETLVGSSPERLVAVRGGRVENRPIAGTRARSADPEEDLRLGMELLADPKERAEHDMLVDLARNDLGRVARTGSVVVREYARLESFARVQHLVSRVECELAAGRDALDALAACFPAGTVSGAPKLRAMELLHELEGEPRGAYAGAFGYLDAAGQLDMALMIRTFVVASERLTVQAGAGVVHDSRPEREYRETLEKAGALFEALRLASTPAFQPRAS